MEQQYEDWIREARVCAERHAALSNEAQREEVRRLALTELHELVLKPPYPNPTEIFDPERK